MNTRAGGLVLPILLVLAATPAPAQNWSFDARAIGLGGGGADHIATTMIEQQRDYRSIVLPFGLIQVLKDIDVFNPDSDAFDIVRAVEYAAAPLHYVIGRDSSEADTGRNFVVDVRNARLSRDLNDYRGFDIANQPAAEGLAAPSYGGTIPIARGDGGVFHGIYVGAGPYLSMRSALAIDDRLVDLLASDTPVYLPNTGFTLLNGSRGQLAAAFTGGYRGRIAWPEGIGSGAAADGLYVAANYNYLRGFWYENVTTALLLDTDSSGLLTFNPFRPSPLVIDRDTSTSGRGFAIDLGVGGVVDRISFGFGATGIANRITWTAVEQRTYLLTNLFAGSADFGQGSPLDTPDVRVELPVDYRGQVQYDSDRFTLLADAGHGFQGTSFHGGYEHHVGAIDLRGGAYYTRERWSPTGGVGLNFGRRVALDLAVFGSAINLARDQRPAIAVSLRINE